MNEDFLHYLWEHLLFDRRKLVSTNGFTLEILKAGEHNQHAGPDFFNAMIKINGTLWAGTVEMHLRSSDWNRHKHEGDKAYDNCILHVVLEHDEEVKMQNGETVTCLELKDRFSPVLWENYQALVQSHAWIACEHRLKDVNSLLLNNWLDKLLSERIESRFNNTSLVLEKTKNDWDETFYQLLCSAFGFQVNVVPFQMLARILPYQIIRKHQDRQLSLEALLLGCAGFLGEESADEYMEKLKFTFNHYRYVYRLKVLDKSAWKFLRLRPGNFPTIRLVQLAGLLARRKHIFSEVLELEDWKQGIEVFNVRISGYWSRHYLFGKSSSEIVRSIGQKSIESIFINAVVPILFAYGKKHDSEKHLVNALKILGQIPAEDNAVLRKWASLGLKANSAIQSQALLELKKNYCSEKKCLFCRIGTELVNTLP